MGNRDSFAKLIEGISANIGSIQGYIEGQAEEIAYLHSIIDLYIAMYGLVEAKESIISKAKAEARKEFAEILHEKLYSVPVVYRAHFGRMIDSLVKEMEG